MGRPEKPLDPSGGAVAAFARDLRLLRAQAGNPTYRQMARSALFSPSVLSNAASGYRLPTLQVTLAFVAACDGDLEAWERRWRLVSGDPAGNASAGNASAGNASAGNVGGGSRGGGDVGGGGNAGGAAARDCRPSAGAGDQPGATTVPRMPHPRQLPLRPRAFVGRTGALRWLDAASTRSRPPAVIWGPVGVGTSALALHYAHQLAQGMVDGQLYADLATAGSGTDLPLPTLDGLLQALGVEPGQLPADPGQRAGLYRSILAERKLVVLLDNVRDERQIRPLLTETRRSATIVASRSPLLGLRGVRRIELGVLPRSDSMAMLAALVNDPDRWERRAGDRLAELCDDLPLALDAVGRKLFAYPNLTPSEVVGRISRPGRLLAWLRIGDIDVREALMSAYRQVGRRGRKLLAWLSQQVSDPIRVTAVAAATGLAGDAAGDLLDELVMGGLLRRVGTTAGNYRMGALLRSFGQDLDPRNPQLRASNKLIVYADQSYRPTDRST